MPKKIKSHSNLVITTVNVPEKYIDAIYKLIGENGLYPSRSEVLRVAVREFLIEELNLTKNIAKQLNVEDPNFDDDQYVRVPIDIDEDGVKEFKTYKILRRLEY